jgi:GNAT superfamily N-acetyltransferase
MTQFDPVAAVVEMKPGTQWDEATRQEIYAFVVAAGAVPAHQALRTNLRTAKRLALMRDGGKLVAVGAVKTPQASYLARLKDNSGIDVTEYNAELGYIATSPEYRRRGCATRIVDVLLDNFKGPIFATTSNTSIAAMLCAHHFTPKGKTWPSRANMLLTLFVAPKTDDSQQTVDVKSANGVAETLAGC